MDTSSLSRNWEDDDDDDSTAAANHNGAGTFVDAIPALAGPVRVLGVRRPMSTDSSYRPCMHIPIQLRLAAAFLPI